MRLQNRFRIVNILVKNVLKQREAIDSSCFSFQNIGRPRLTEIIRGEEEGHYQ